ncbi:MAG TPA: thrombospondin type 3 repeat-containing protein, partial [Candidatus Polarisedimenticolia bacterium]|nr:thrombospondin type 3 repeat-containing protein [Candidatus Polarisedimenticolia bacterium]
LRLRIETGGLRTLTDPAVTGPVFDGLALAVDHFVGPPHPNLPGEPGFVESDSPRIDLPAGSAGDAGDFVSIDTPGGFRAVPAVPLDGRARSEGSNEFLAGPGSLPWLDLDDMLDADGDGLRLPIDPCPALADPDPRDADLDGIGDVCDPAVVPGSPITDRWESQPDQPGTPTGLSGAAAAFDTARGVTVLFGGSSSAATWEFDGTAWHAFFPTPSPAPRSGHAMTWDADRRRVILYGGMSQVTGAVLGDLWEYDGARHRWMERTLPAGPGPRAWHGMTRDARLRALVVFGGLDDTHILGDTWLLRGIVWRRIPTPQSPAPRNGAMLAYDARRERTVLLGGSDGGPTGGLLNDVWEFDGADWEPVDARGDLPPTARGVLVYDPVRRTLVLFGGEALRAIIPDPAGGNSVETFIGPMAATRLFDGVRFRPLPTLDTTTPRTVPAAAFDAIRGTLLVVGGVTPAHLTADIASLSRAADGDGDGIPDDVDLCPEAADPDQADADGDGVGDACDNCPADANRDQRDLDRDLAGDACDGDRDGDRVENLLDVCPDAHVAGRPFTAIGAGGGGDRDADGRADDCDRCPDDPADDADGDGFCAGEDNCPTAFNPTQRDRDTDGSGDACQPTVDIVAIGPLAFPRNSLGARVQVRDPNGDRLAGRIMVTPATVLPDIISGGLDPCAVAFAPDGAPGGGLIYAVVPGTAPVITDADTIFGCFDGVPDFEFYDGTCAAGAGQIGRDAITIDHPAPFPICVRRLDGSGAQFDLTLVQAAADAAVLTGTAGPVLDLGWSGRLPLSVSLAPLGAPGAFLLRITAGDGSSIEAADERLFTWSGERTLFFNLPGGSTGSAP